MLNDEELLLAAEVSDCAVALCELVSRLMGWN